MRYLALILLLILSGCSQANTRGDQMVREYNIKIRNTGYLVVYTPLDVTAGTKTGTSVDAANSPTTRNNANASLAGQGATATGAVGEAVKQALEGVESVSRRILKDSHNQQAVQEQPAPVEKEKEQVEQKPAPKPKPEPVVDNGTSAPADFDLAKIHWLHTDVSKWPVTSKLRSVKIAGDKITLDYDAANKWPGGGVVANPWIFVKHGGKWYAATWGWLRPGQTTKALYAVSGSHIKRDPLKKFKPTPGETYGFMVSGLARDRKRNVKERTNIVWIKWPGGK